MPGAQFNSLRLAVHAALGLKPTAARVKAWKSVAPAFADRFRLFSRGARSWLLARRLADTLADALASTRSDVLPRALLADQRQALFGSPMSSGGGAVRRTAGRSGRIAVRGMSSAPGQGRKKSEPAILSGLVAFTGRSISHFPLAPDCQNGKNVFG